MGGRNGGRPRKPTQMKIAEGNKGKRKLDLSTEPQFRVLLPPPPEHLSEYGLEEWTYISKVLFDAGLMTEPDSRALAGYCESYATWRQSCEEIKKGGNKLVYMSKEGKPLPNPYIKIGNEALTRMLAFLIQFGLTPASRSKITIGEKAIELDPFEEFQKEKEIMRGKLRQINGAN